MKISKKLKSWNIVIKLEHLFFKMSEKYIAQTFKVGTIIYKYGTAIVVLNYLGEIVLWFECTFEASSTKEKG